MPTSFVSSAWVILDAGLACGHNRTPVLVRPSPYTLSYSHRAQKNCPQDVRELFKGSSTLTLLYRPTVMIQTTPHLTQGKSWLKGGEGTQVGHTPTSDAVQSPPSPRAVPSRLCFLFPTMPKASDPFDRLKSGGTRRRVLLPPLSCSPPLPGAPGYTEQQ